MFAKRAILFLNLLLLAGLCPGLCAGLCADAQEQTLRVVGGESYAPFVYAGEDGAPKGILVDFWQLWSQKTGRPINIELKPWSEVPAALAQNQADVICGLFASQDRAIAMDFSRSLLEVPAHLFFHKAIHGLKDLSDAHDFEIGVVRGDYAEEFARSALPDGRFINFPSYKRLIEAALAAKITVFVADTPSAEYYLAQDPQGLKTFTHVQSPLYSLPLRAAVRKGDTRLLAQVNEGLDAISTEEKREILSHWLGATSMAPQIIRWLLLSLCLAMLIIAAAIFCNAQLRGKVRKATLDLEEQHRQVQKSEQALRSMFSAMVNLVLELDREGNIVHVVPTRYQFRDLSPKILAMNNIADILPPSSVPKMLDAIATVLAEGQLREIEIEIPLQTSKVWFLAGLTPMNEDTVLAVGRDITNRKRAERELSRRERYYTSLIENSFDMVTVIDQEGTILFESPAARHCLQLSPAELMGQDMRREIHPDDVSQFNQTLHSVLHDPEYRPTMDIRRRNSAGEWLSLEAHVTNMLQDEAVTGIIINSHDITQRKRSEQELQRRIFMDSLTGLPNRALLLDRLGHAFERMRRHKGYQFAIMYIDLDRFKLVNESFGHATGDLLLKALGQRIANCMRRVDTVSRYMGDDFVILLEDIKEENEALNIAKRITQELSLPHHIQDMDILCRASIGIAFSSPSYEYPEQIVRDADTAMRRAKRSTQEPFKVFHATMKEPAVNILKLETDLRQGIERKEFVLHYQPVVDMPMGRIVGMEALIRWQHPERGLLPPAEFIPLAEETGLILPLGEFILQEACQRQAHIVALWKADPEAIPFMAVNISAKQFQQQRLAENVRAILQSYDLPASLLHLEITESMVMDNAKEAGTILAELKDLGVNLSIDDFGTGYSSLSYLYLFPFDTLKIDRSFVSGGLPVEGKHANILEAIIGLAASLEMDVIAEGVETENEKDRLIKLGCVYGQGYYYAKPMAPQALDDYLTAQFKA